MIVYEDPQLTIFQSVLYQTNTLIYKASSFVLLVDPNWLPDEVQLIRDYLDRNFQGISIYLLFTHSDYDHIIGYGLFPEAKVIASQRFQDNIDKEKIIQEIHTFDQQHYLKRSYDIVYPEVDFIISKDGEQLEIGDERLTFYLSPGHTADGLFTIIGSAGFFIAGDYLSNLEFPFIYYNIQAYKNTLRKVDSILQNHIVNIMIPGHGDFVKDNNNEILKRRNRDMEYLVDLKESILTGSKFPLEQWLNRYPFPKDLEQAHYKNEQNCKKLLGS